MSAPVSSFAQVLPARAGGETGATVSVVMPAYNEQRYVDVALASVLSQTGVDFEVIVVDDGSTDGTRALLEAAARRDRRLTVLGDERNRGVVPALNLALDHARGRYIARMDADDIAMPGRLAAQVAFMEANPAVGICGGAIDIIDAEGRTVAHRDYRLDDASIRRRIFRYSPFCHPAVMMRAAVLRAAGPYRERFHPAEDYELYFRLGRQASFANLPDTVLRYRATPDSVSHHRAHEAEKMALSVRAEIFRTGDYPVSVGDRIWTLAQAASFGVVPTKTRLRVFRRLRDRGVKSSAFQSADR